MLEDPDIVGNSGTLDAAGQFFLFSGNFRGEVKLSTCAVTCGLEPAPRFLPGLCGGEGDGDAPSIASAVFGLEYLFREGPEPPCRAACETNGDGELDLSDMVYILLHLFSGGPAPTNGSACTEVLEDSECAEPGTICN